jgi:hypothetical protein
MDDHDLEKDFNAPSKRSRFGSSDWLMVLVAVAVVGGGAAWWWFHREAAPPPETPVAASNLLAPAAEPVKPVAATLVKELLEAISVSAVFRGWLTQGDLLERWAVVTDNLAEGVSPRARLSFLAPKDRFTTTRRAGKQVISAATYARYDSFADVIGSIDVAAASRAYRELHEPLQAAYRAIGYPEGSLDKVTAAALKRLVAAPAHDGDVVVQAGGTGPGTLFIYTAPELERLGPVEKHLLRMGPRNTRIIQAKARQLERSLGLPGTDAR